MKEKKTCSCRKRSRRSKNKSGRKKGPAARSFREAILVAESNTGKVLVSQNAAELFNPASNIKVATALSVLQKLGADYRYECRVYLSGEIGADGILSGNLIVSGNYMLFGDKQARELAQILNKKGIKTIQGDLVVAPDFTMNLHAYGLAAGMRLRQILDSRRGRNFQFANHEEPGTLPFAPSVNISGKVTTGAPSASDKLLATHFSPRLKHILKIMLCYSDNTMAERFGEQVGGANGIRQHLLSTLSISASELNLASASGLGINRVSPQAMLKIIMATRDECSKWNLDLTDLLAVAGVDDGTLKKRLAAPGQAGSVVGKTGTLIQTDNGASALCGEVSTTNAVFDFVIFHMHGDVNAFRQRQDAYLSEFQKKQGGAKVLPYSPILPGIDFEDYWL